MRAFAPMLSLLLLCTSAMPVQAGRRDVLVDPAPIQVPGGLPADAVPREIKRALLGRGWAVSAERPGVIESTLFLRGHEARIAIQYDARNVAIHYQDSANLDYEEAGGQRWIHSNYLGWIGFLVHDLDTNLGISAGGG